MCAGVCICGITSLTEPSNKHHDAFPLVLSFASFCALHYYWRARSALPCYPPPPLVFPCPPSPGSSGLPTLVLSRGASRGGGGGGAYNAVLPVRSLNGGRMPNPVRFSYRDPYATGLCGPAPSLLALGDVAVEGGYGGGGGAGGEGLGVEMEMERRCTAVLFSLQSLCLTPTRTPTGVAVSHRMTRFQTPLILSIRVTSAATVISRTTPEPTPPLLLVIFGHVQGLSFSI